MKGASRMGNKPSDFFLGVFEIFAILLPGGIALLLLVNWDGWKPSGSLIPHSETTSWIVLLIGSYVLGHLLAAIGSVLLDPLYDRFYKKAIQADEVLKAEKVPSIARFRRRWKYAVTNSEQYVKKTCLQTCADTYKR